MSVRPWERQPNESPAAFGAFRTYLELGPGRSVVEAYRQANDRRDATQASGRWNAWVKDHDWEGRARAWDNRAVGVRQKATERAIAATAEDWVRRQAEQHELEFQLGRRLLEKADQLSGFPVTRTTAERDGQPVTIEPIDPSGLRTVALVAKEGSTLARAAIEGALATARVEDPMRDPDRRAVAMDRASDEIQEWRAEKRLELMAIPLEPPEGPSDDGESGDGQGRG